MSPGTVSRPPSPLAQARHWTRVWFWASRPFSLTASVVPVLVGSALAFAEGRANPLLLALMLVASVLVQAGTNLVDEYGDHERPEGRQKLLAPYKVIALGLLSPRAVRRGALVSFGVATAVGLYLVAVTGWPLLAVCLASLAVAYLYAGGPKPLGSLGLGQPLVFVFMGVLMVAAVYYVHTHTVTRDALLLSLPVACLVTAILVANDLRDLEEDAAAGKVTPVTLWGRPFGRRAWTALVAGAYAAVVALVVWGAPGPWALLPLLALPTAVRAGRVLWRGETRPALGVGMRLAAALHWRFGLLLAAGVALGRVAPWP